MIEAAELRRTLTLANEFKEGDLRVGGTRDDRLRAEARRVVASLRLGELACVTLVEDGVSEMLARSRDALPADEISHLTVAEFKSLLLDPVGPEWVRHYRHGFSSEAVAAVVKIMANDVAGFIGPEVFRSGEQLLRACLEDTVMAKLHGLTMGLDVCSTFHMGVDPEALDQLTETIVRLAAPAYLMAVAGNADPMLGYLTTSFRQHPRLQRRTGRRPTTAMRRRLRELGVPAADKEPVGKPECIAALYAAFRDAAGDARSAAELRGEARRTLAGLQRRGYDLGLGHGPDYRPAPAAAERLRRLYHHARRALYARLDEAVLRDVSPHALRIRTQAADRDEYLAHPAAGERIREEDEGRVGDLYTSRRPSVQIVISDGLNANAITASALKRPRATRASSRCFSPAKKVRRPA